MRWSYTVTEKQSITLNRRNEMVKVDVELLNNLLSKEYLVEAIAKVMADDGSNDVKIAQIAAILQM